MRVLAAVCLLLMGDLCSAFARDTAVEGSSLAQLIEAYERLEKEMTEAQQRLKQSPTPSQSSLLRKRIEELQTEQETLASALEERVGPLPPAVRPEKPIPLEHQVGSQERRHESVLDADVERRFKR